MRLINKENLKIDLEWVEIIINKANPEREILIEIVDIGKRIISFQINKNQTKELIDFLQKQIQ